MNEICRSSSWFKHFKGPCNLGTNTGSNANSANSDKLQSLPKERGSNQFKRVSPIKPVAETKGDLVPIDPTVTGNNLEGGVCRSSRNVVKKTNYKLSRPYNKQKSGG